jgi:hypothetical protein
MILNGAFWLPSLWKRGFLPGMIIRYLSLPVQPEGVGVAVGRGVGVAVG